MLKTSKGKLSQLAFLAAACRKDAHIAVPFSEQSGWDALIKIDGTWRSVQVKSMYLRRGSVKTVDVLKGGGSGKTTEQRRYRDGDFDFLAAVDGTTGCVWMIPASVALGRRSISLKDEWLW